MSARAVITVTGTFEIPIQGWTDDAKLDQVKRQAREETSNWKILLQEGLQDPKPLPKVKSEVTHVIIEV